jgi:hypothetical protein
MSNNTPTLDGLITFNVDDLTTNSLVVNNDELIYGSLNVNGNLKKKFRMIF